MKTYGQYLNGIFPGMKVQKLSVDAGFSCPNRDGTISFGGCIYCRNDSFTPNYCNPADSVRIQLEKGKNFFSRKYPKMKYLAYFQSYTGTHGKNTEVLKQLYQEAIETSDIVGLVIATRPDSISSSTLSLFEELRRKTEIFVEIGAETSHDKTLKIINRNHTWLDVVKTVCELSSLGIHCGLHLIAGLPSESEEMILDTIKKTVELPIETLKLHQLQILRDTELCKQWVNKKLNPTIYELEEYLALCKKIIKIIPKTIIIERFLSQSPSELVIAPKWGLKNYEFMHLLQNT